MFNGWPRGTALASLPWPNCGTSSRAAAPPAPSAQAGSSRVFTGFRPRIQGSVHPVSEQVARQGQVHQAKDHHRPELVEEQVEWRAFEEHAAQDHEEIAQRVEVGDRKSTRLNSSHAN